MRLSALIEPWAARVARTLKRPVMVMAIDRHDDHFHTAWASENLRNREVEALAMDLLRAVIAETPEDTGCEDCRSRRERCVAALASLEPAPAPESTGALH